MIGLIGLLLVLYVISFFVLKVGGVVNWAWYWLPLNILLAILFIYAVVFSSVFVIKMVG